MAHDREGFNPMSIYSQVGERPWWVLRGTNKTFVTEKVETRAFWTFRSTFGPARTCSEKTEQRRGLWCRLSPK